MRVPTQRASRSGSATSPTTPGKRISSSSSSAAPSSGGVHSVKKRKIHSDAGTTAKGSGADAAATSKKKLTKKTIVKKDETGGGMKTSTILTKKLTPRKTTTAVLSVGLKRSKTQLKKLPPRKISVVTIASKAHKKIVKSVKTLAAKKHMSVGKKGNAFAADNGAGTSNSEERVKTAETTSEAVQVPQKRPPGRPPLHKNALKTAKARGRKPKVNTLVTVSTSINRAKKIAQDKNISLKKNNLKKQTTVSKNTTAVQESHQQPITMSTEEKKKGKVGRKKTIGISAEPPEEISADKLPDVKEKEETVEEKENVESDGQEASKNQNVEKLSGKVGIKKTKEEEEVALKTKTKKKLIKKKPKIEAESIAKEEVASVVISETAKENKDNTPKKDGKELPSGKLKSELLRKKQNSKLNESSEKKIEPSKKNLVSKTMKIVSTKVKKATLSSPKSSEKKKPQVKIAAAAKEQAKPVIKKELPQPVANVTDKKCSSDNGEDSSTSDEITLDMLMRQHFMKQETCPKRDPVPADASIVVRNHSDCGDSVSSPASTRPDDSVSRMSEIVSSPMAAITSDEEDLKTMKNRIKVKLEKNSEERSTSPLFAVTEKEISSKDKENDSAKPKASAKKDTIKDEKSDGKKSSESDDEKPKPKKILKSPTGVKRVRGEGAKGGNGSDTEQRARRMKLFGFWSGPKRHRVASLNALAKVHCLYENESRGALYALCNASQLSTPKTSKSSTAQASSRNNTSTSEAPTSTATTTSTSTRTLRSAPGLRGMGKHWDMHNASSTSSSSSSSSSSDENDSSSDSPAPRPSVSKPKVQRPAPKVALKKNVKQLKNVKKVVRRRRNKNELMMDLKDMVVRKRMASLNASAILAASYSMEKRSPKVAKEETTADGDSNAKKKKAKKVVTKKVVEVEEDTTSTVNSEVEVEDCGSSRSVIEVRTTPSNSSNKVAVIVNQDTDVTITGVYVNSTTRSTHHEGYCSIAGMQYRISSTSHTQTEATAVATETVLHTSTAAEHPTPTQHPAEPPLAMPMKSYTPLGALSSMQPPGAPVTGGPAPHHHHLHPHPHPHPHPPCNVPPQQPPPPPPPPPHRGPVNPPPISPLGRRHGCASAFSAPPSASYGPPPPPPPPQHHQQPPPHHHPPPPPPQGQQDPGYIHGYYQPAGPLISTHHHHHSSSSSSTSASNAGKAVLPPLEASPNPTPPPAPPQQSQQQPPSSSSTTTTPQQIVSVTSASGGGDESSDNDVIITATSCSGGGETHPPPPPPPPHHPPYRYPQSYPTPSTPQHIHHQSYTYNYPHTQYYPSPPASASIQYSANPPGLQQHHHYHNQDLCYSSGAPSYPPASYFHHKSYSTPPPPPPTFHRRYIQQPPSHQYYPPDLYAAPASNGSQQSSAQSQQSQQQMVVTGSATGSASSYQLGVSSNPPLVETYPPPVSIVDPYPPPPGYYAGYSAGPGAAGCYSHSPPTRSLAFIDAAAYQTCPCPMQSCPKNVHTGPLTGDGKGPHLSSKQTQPPPQESGASFHQLPLPPVALALPLEPPGALGPPSPARGSAGMPPPPSPATASARNPSHAQEISWESSSQQEASKPEPKVSETELKSSVEVPQELQNKPDNTTTLPSEEVRHRLLAISNIVPKPEAVVCRTKSKKRRSPPAADTAKSDNNVPLLMCDHEFRKKRQQNSSDIVVTKVDEITILDMDLVCDSVKTELKEVEKETAVTKPQTEKEVADCRNVDQNDEMAAPRKRKLDEPGSETAKTENEATVPKRRKPSNVGLITNGLLAPGKDSAKTSVTETQDEVVKTPTSQPKCKNAQKSQPLSSNSSLHNSKQQVRKRKLDDTKDLAENKEPQLSAPAKKKSTTKVVKLQNTQTKVYPSRVVPSKKVPLKVSEVPKRVEEMVNSALAKSRTVLEPLANAKRNNSSNLTAVNKKTLGSKNVERKKTETKINGTLPCSKKASQKLPTTKVQDSVNSIDAAKSRASNCTSNRAVVEVKKGQHKKKPESVEVLSTKKSRATNSLRSQLRDSLSDQTSSDDSESLPPKGKSSLVGTTRRLSSGSKKELIKTSVKKPGSGIIRTDGHKKPQQPQEQQMDPEDKTNQEASQILAALSRRSAPKKTLQMPKWSNGWKFEGEPFENRVFLSSDDVSVIRKCYPLMRHEEGDVICPRDCILLKSGPRKTDLPFVAKVAALWENPEDGEMMVSLLWYYRPEHTDHGRRPDDMEDEIFASKHKDINSVACIEDKCYVLTFNEYCRYRKCVRRIEDGVKEPGLVVPQHIDYPRENRQPPGCVAPELVFFCRRVYDFRQRRILKNPG